MNGLCCRKHHLPQRQARIIDEERGVVADQAGQIRQWSFQPHCNYGHAAAVAIAAREVIQAAVLANFHHEMGGRDVRAAAQLKQLRLGLKRPLWTQSAGSIR